ncbi:DUF7351 domain-containing protein [Natronoglomus mannanivorans]|uniref:DUF7351 domain-containing protein n=1 Tax=Natronoglomus mannanivorans TaxID=2979990 RepID=UPI003CCDE359
MYYHESQALQIRGRASKRPECCSTRELASKRGHVRKPRFTYFCRDRNVSHDSRIEVERIGWRLQPREWRSFRLLSRSRRRLRYDALVQRRRGARTRRAIRVANRRTLWYCEAITWDVCPHCAGHFDEATIDTVSVSDYPWFAAIGCESSTLVTFGLRCQRCGVSFRMPAFYYVLTRPPTIAFFHDHDIDYRSLELEYGSYSWTWETIPREDGVPVRLVIDDELLEIELDRTLETRSYRRTARE